MNKPRIYLWFSFISFTFSTFMISPFLSLYTLHLGGDEFIVGMVYAVFTLSTLSSRIPLARFSHVIGEGAMLELGHITSAVGIILYSLAQSPYYLFLGSAVRGLGFSLYHPSALSMTVDENAVESRRMTGIILTAPPMGMMLGPAFGALMLEKLGFSGLFYVASLVSILGIIPAYLMARNKELIGLVADNNAVRESRRFDRVLNNVVLSVMFVRLSLSYATATIVAFLPVLLEREMGFGKLEIGALFSLAAFANMLARPLSGYLSSKIGEARTIYLGMGFMFAAVMLLLTSIQTVIWVGIIFYGSAMGLFIPSSVLLISRTVPIELRTLSLAYVTTMIDVGSSLGSFGSGAISSAAGISTAFATALLVIVVTTIVSATLYRRQSPAP